jgi:hypothetical protein
MFDTSLRHVRQKLGRESDQGSTYCPRTEVQHGMMRQGAPEGWFDDLLSMNISTWQGVWELQYRIEHCNEI